MILKGGYIPRDKPRINSYKLTNKGYALLNLVEKVKGAGAGKEQESQPQPRQEQQQKQYSSSRR